MRRRWAWASLFGLTYLALNVFVDTHTIPAVALLMGLPIAVLDATSSHGIRLPLVPFRVACWLRNAAVALLVLACLASVQQLISSESVAMTHQEAVAAASEGEWADALAPALEAANADPTIGVYGMTAALALAAEGDWEGAERAYRAVIDVDQLPEPGWASRVLGWSWAIRPTRSRRVGRGASTGRAGASRDLGGRMGVRPRRPDR